MAIIDSGLGWSCNEDYLVTDADTYLSQHSVIFLKTYDGAAIAAEVTTQGSGNIAPFLISTVEDNVKFTENNTAGGSCVINGVTWYYSSRNYANSTVDENATIPRLTLSGDDDDADWVQALLTAANMELDDKIPTTDYVKGYVEGITKGNNNIILPQISAKADKDYVQSKTVKNYLPYPYSGITPYSELTIGDTSPEILKIKDDYYRAGMGGTAEYIKGKLWVQGAYDGYELSLTGVIPTENNDFIKGIKGKIFCVLGDYQYVKPAIKEYNYSGTLIDTIYPDAQTGLLTIPDLRPVPMPNATYYAEFVLEFRDEGTYSSYQDCMPMICDADSDLTTWTPYAKTNEEITGYCTKQYVAFSHDENNLTQTRELIFPVRENSIGLGMLTLSGVVEVYGRVNSGSTPQITKRVNVFGKFTMYEEGTFGKSYNIGSSSSNVTQNSDTYSPDTKYFPTPMFGCCAPSTGGTSSQPTPGAEFIATGFSYTTPYMPVNQTNLSIIDAAIKITHNKNKFTVQLLDNSQYTGGGTGNYFIYRAMLELDAVFM